MTLELGLDTFGDVTALPDGTPRPAGQVIRDVVEEAVLADRVGLDFFGIGEHHRADFAVSAPEVVLAAIAGRTERIRLGSAVTVLSSDDPVRVYERFATLDGVSDGRAEVILGRGSFVESFPLFGYDLTEYEDLFEEKLELFDALRTEKAVSWAGSKRASLKNQHVYPKTERGSLTTWIGVGGSPESVVRTARYGLPMMLAIIGGEPARFRPYVDLYWRALGEFGWSEQPGGGPGRVGVHSPGTSPRPTSRPGRRSTSTSRRRTTGSAPSAAGRPTRAPASGTTSGPTARCTSGRPRPWPRRSRRPSTGSARPGSTSSTRPGRCPTRR
ncbi:hypothetical protein GCM10025864_16320 [Luteimicrobium album]|uniref:Luciferase-like domain-containing protein n=1 Tax=Luteimicrobium album TaxID=1054550 RepID=A0ABQ6I1Q2_9MICO|nr:hypothetical protein GCM10025864_16320 [Luteimicrobium album]